MKKFLAVFMALLIFSAFSVNALAASSPVSVGERIVSIYSWSSGQVVLLGTITYEVFSDGSVKVKGTTSTSPNFAVNPDGTITLTRTKSSDNKFIGWLILGEYDIVSGTLLSDKVTIRSKGDIKVYEMYDLPPFIDSTIKVFFNDLMSLFKELTTIKPGETTITKPGETTTKPSETTTAKPGETTTKPIGPIDEGPVSPPTGNNLLALGAIALISLSVAVVAKKRHD